MWLFRDSTSPTVSGSSSSLSLSLPCPLPSCLFCFYLKSSTKTEEGEDIVTSSRKRHYGAPLRMVGDAASDKTVQFKFKPLYKYNQEIYSFIIFFFQLEILRNQIQLGYLFSIIIIIILVFDWRFTIDRQHIQNDPKVKCTNFEL